MVTTGQQLKRVKDLKVKIFADGADLQGMVEMAKNPIIQGFTTNPTLMRKAGVQDYAAFAREVLSEIPDRSISFEVFADEPEEMEEQAHEIASWGENVYVKVPVTNTRGVSSVPLLRRLAASRLKLNVTALMTLYQVEEVSEAVTASPSSYLSIFAGRIADTGRDPMPIMAEAVRLLCRHPHLELIWASPREVLNIVHADQVGCQIITITNDLLMKLSLFGKSLEQFSLDTVQMFYQDAKSAGFEIVRKNKNTPLVRRQAAGV